MNKFLLAVPAFCDFVTSTLQYISLNFISGSVYQMMRGGTIVTTFIFSIVFLKAKVKKSQIAGCILAFAGVTIVGLSNMVFSSSDSGSADAVTHSLHSHYKSQGTSSSSSHCSSMDSSSSSNKSYSPNTILSHCKLSAMKDSSD